MLTEEEYQTLLRVSGKLDWRFRVAPVLAHETGHRIGAIRKLRWSDIDLDGRTVLWRAEHEKTGREHTTPVAVEALSVLEEASAMRTGAGDAPVLPTRRNPFECVSQSLTNQWWGRAERLAGLEPKSRRGWHSLRRKFASDLMDLPLKVLCELGGWRDTKTCAPLLPAHQRVATPGGARQPSSASHLKPVSGNRTAGTRTVGTVNAVLASGWDFSAFRPLDKTRSSLFQYGNEPELG